MKARIAFVLTPIMVLLWFGACSDTVQDMIDDSLQGEESVLTAGDKCEMCAYSEEGTYYCKEVPCEGGCLFRGEYYAVGKKFDASDHCNTCICEDFGVVSCTEIACEG